MNAGEQAFLAASDALEQSESAERDAQRQRALEAAQQLAATEQQAATRLRLRNRLITAVGGTAVVLAVLAGTFAVRANQHAHQAQRNLMQADQQRTVAQHAQATAQAASAQAIADFTRSEAQRLAAEANSLLVRNGDTNVIALLTVRSLTMRYTPSGDAMLANLSTLEIPPREFTGHMGDVWGVAFSPDGKGRQNKYASHSAMPCRSRKGAKAQR